MSLMKSNWRRDCPTLFDALLEGVSAQNRRYLNAYGGLKFLNLNDLVAVLIQDIIEQ